MNTPTRIILLLLVTVVIAVALGPRPEVDATLRDVQLPADLDTYLAESEARYPDLIPDVEKRIVWASDERRPTPVSVVYLHGFSATRQETAPLADSVAARLGANLFYTRLSGHGRSDDAMAEATINDWLNDTMEAMAIGRRLGERVLVLGTSTGGTLATWLATRPEAAGLLAVVLISPNYAPRDGKSTMLLWPWGAQLARSVVGPYYEWEAANADHERFWKTRYPSETLVPMMGLVDYVNGLDLETVTSPVLVFYSPADEVVASERIVATFPRFGAATKRIVRLYEVGDPSNHVLAGAILSPEQTMPMAEQIVAFVTPLITPLAP